MHAGRGIHKLEIEALVAEDVQPQLQLKNAEVVLKPTEAKISPLSATRDVIPDGRQVYQNLLAFNLNVAKAADVSIYAPIFNDLLYEAEFESQMWMLFDANKALVATGDAHSHTSFTKLDKGEYTIRLQVRHEKRDLLEKISEANLVASFKLTSPLTLDFYENYNQCIVGGRKYVSSPLRLSTRVLYIAPITQERLTKANLPAQCAWLSGNLVFPQDEVGRRVAQHPFTYILNPAEKKSHTNGSSNGSSAAGSTATAAAVTTANGAKPKAPATPQAATSVTNPTLDFYENYNQCIVGGRKYVSSPLRLSTRVLYIAPITQERLTKANLPAQCAWLSGNLVFPQDEVGRRVAQHPFTYILNPAEKKSHTNGSSNGSSAAGSTATAAAVTTANGAKPKAPATPQAATSVTNPAAGDGISVQNDPPVDSSGSPASPKKGKANADDYAESFRDFQCSQIVKCGRILKNRALFSDLTYDLLTELEMAEKIYNDVVAAHPKHLQANLLLIQNIESNQLKSQLPLTFVNAQKTSPPEAGESADKQKEDQKKVRSALERIVKLADKVIQETDAEALLSYYGLKNDTRADAAKIKTYVV